MPNEVAAHALWGVGRVRTHLHNLGRQLNTAHTAQELHGTLNGIAVACQARPLGNDVALAGKIGRMLEPSWWRRNLSVQMLRQNEAIEHGAGSLRRKKQCYVSNHAMKVLKAKDKKNQAVLENLEVENELGQAFNLMELVEGSNSNPKVRRGELMTRCRGFEETANFFGHEAVFITLTAPSRFHRFDGAGQPNKKWTGATPKDAQEHLQTVWERTRAEWGRKGFFPYGFRVAEPHHDGCPHWHLLLWAPKEHLGWFVPRRLLADRPDFGAGLLGIMGAKALADCPTERGALEHRFKVVWIDGAQGATGYIAKYICKNVDGLKENGEGMGVDFDSGTDVRDSSKRVRAWARTWGIRQFQQVGGPSVTVWRELRRLGKDLAQPLQRDLFELPRSAADRAMWSLFWILQGGPDVRRKDLTLKPEYVGDKENRYGEKVKRVWGVLGTDEDGELGLKTRLHEWKVQRAGLADVNTWQAEHFDSMAVQKTIDEFVKAAGFSDVSDFNAGEACAWTGVNNCTDSQESEDTPEEDDGYALFLDSLRGAGGAPLGKPNYESINSGHSGPCRTNH